jgi:3-oxoacid CoA-transferase A subunit
MISPMPFHPTHGGPVKERWQSGELEVEVVSQGVLAERLRAGGAGIGGVFLPSSSGTRFVEGKEVRQYDGREHVLELALKADFALLRAMASDTLGNMVYDGTARNWNPTMAMAAGVTVVEVDAVHEPGGIDPELVITQAIFIDRLVLSA